jgi:hypothetical protein
MQFFQEVATEVTPHHVAHGFQLLQNLYLCAWILDTSGELASQLFLVIYFPDWHATQIFFGGLHTNDCQMVSKCFTLTDGVLVLELPLHALLLLIPCKN